MLPCFQVSYTEAWCLLAVFEGIHFLKTCFVQRAEETYATDQGICVRMPLWIYCEFRSLAWWETVGRTCCTTWHQVSQRPQNIAASLMWSMTWTVRASDIKGTVREVSLNSLVCWLCMRYWASFCFRFATVREVCASDMGGTERSELVTRGNREVCTSDTGEQRGLH